VGRVDNTATVAPPAGIADPEPGNNSATVSTQAGSRVFLPLVLRDY
jgi:hypothetical protein